MMDHDEIFLTATAMADAARALAKPDAAERIADLILEEARMGEPA